MAQRKDISIHFIAQQCGVSTATVSRVLNNDRRVAEKTRVKVRAALDRYGYVMPMSAERNPRIGVIIDSELSDYYIALVAKVREQIRKADMRVVMISLDQQPDEMSVCLETMYDCGVAGVILIACPYLAIREKINAAIPHVWIDCNDTPEDTPEICQVQSDQYYSGLIAARELIKRDCSKPLILTGNPASHRSLEREKGFRDEFLSHGIPFEEDRILRLTAGVRDALADTRQVILYKAYQKFPFDSIFAISDWRALGAYLALEELGLRIPEDVKLIGFDGVSAVSRSALHITSVQQDIDRIARAASELLLKMLHQETIGQKHVIVPTDILPGQTV